MHSPHSFEGDNFILDFQVVRAAVKAFKALSSTRTSSDLKSSPFTRFLRHLSQLHSKPPSSWHDPCTAVHLLELRALSLVQDYTTHEADPDGSAAQRVAKGVTEAFVAATVAQFIQDVPTQLPGQEAHVVTDLLLLVRYYSVYLFLHPVLITPYAYSFFSRHWKMPW